MSSERYYHIELTTEYHGVTQQRLDVPYEASDEALGAWLRAQVQRTYELGMVDDRVEQALERATETRVQHPQYIRFCGCKDVDCPDRKAFQILDAKLLQTYRCPSCKWNIRHYGHHADCSFRQVYEQYRPPSTGD